MVSLGDEGAHGGNVQKMRWQSWGHGPVYGAFPKHRETEKYTNPPDGSAGGFWHL